MQSYICISLISCEYLWLLATDIYMWLTLKLFYTGRFVFCTWCPVIVVVADMAVLEATPMRGRWPKETINS